MKNGCLMLMIFFLAVSTTGALDFGEEGADKTLTLQIGNPKHKDKTLEVVLGRIQSARKGKPVTFEELAKEIKGSRFVYVGESHDDLAMHDIQFRVIEALYAQGPRVAIGLEMFPATAQDVLDRFNQGIFTLEEFVREAKWYIHWNFNFGYYKKIFEFAQANKIPVYGLNAPRETIGKIRMRGWEALSEEEKRLVPQPDVSHQEHRLLIRTIFESAELPPQMKGEGLDKVFEGLYRSQSAWDEVMAANAVQAAEIEGRRMVVLAGSGHLLYNLGLNRRVQERTKLPFSTVISVPVPKDRKSVQVARSLADFIWGIPEEERPAYPSVGLSFKKFEGLDNLVIERKPIDGVAKGRDFEKGDVVLAVDEKGYVDINELRIYLATFGWDNEVKFRLLRNGEVKDIVLKF